MSKARKYRYFVEHLDDHTNEVLSRYLSPRYECDERELWTGRKCQAWEVPDGRFIMFLKNYRQTPKIKFDAFIQENDYPLRPFPWPIPEKKKPGQKRKAA